MTINYPIHNAESFPILVVYETFDEQTGDWTSSDEDCEVIEAGESSILKLEPLKRRCVVGGLDVE